MKLREPNSELWPWVGVCFLTAILLLLATSLHGCATTAKNLDQTIYVGEAAVLGVQTAVGNCAKDPACKVSNADLNKAEDQIGRATDALQAAWTASKAGDSTTAQGKLAIAQAALQAASTIIQGYLPKGK